MRSKQIFMLLVASLLFSEHAFCNEENTVNLFTTGQTMELDRCASAWLIKRFVNANAVFELYPENSLITEGTVFDRPEGSLQRTHNQATFEVVMTRYSIKNDDLNYLGALIHDSEINFWGKRKYPESKELEINLKEEIAGLTGQDALNKCLQFFDGFIQQPQLKNNP